jgi:PEP-CTERM motif
MSLLASLALVAAGPVLAQCSWDRPGANAFQGDVVAAVDRYSDIPAAVRQALKKRMAARRYDEVADITRDDVVGTTGLYSNLRDMHFGQGTLCRSITRSNWKPETKERGLVYCEQEHCIIVPTVCRNVSRVTRKPKPRTAAAGAGVAKPVVVLAQQTSDAQAPTVLFGSTGATAEPLSFEPPGAGMASPLGAPGALPSDLSGGVLTPLSPATASPTFESLSGLPVPSSSPIANLGSAVPSLSASQLAGPVNFEPVPGIAPVLAASVVPEPSAYAMALAGLGLIVWVRRRRAASRRPPAARA